MAEKIIGDDNKEYWFCECGTEFAGEAEESDVCRDCI